MKLMISSGWQQALPEVEEEKPAHRGEQKQGGGDEQETGTAAARMEMVREI